MIKDKKGSNNVIAVRLSYLLNALLYLSINEGFPDEQLLSIYIGPWC